MSKKKKRHVISQKNLPARLPAISTITTCLLLDRLHAPGWVWGIVCTILALLWIGAIHEMATETGVEVL